MEITPELIEFVKDHASKKYFKWYQLRQYLEIEDFIQESFLLLCIEAERFDPTLFFYGDNFELYYKARFKYFCYKVVNSGKRRVKLEQKESMCTQDELLKHNFTDEDILCDYVIAHSLGEEDMLSECEKKTIELLLQGYRQIDIAKIENVSSAAICYRMQSVRKKLKNKYECYT